MNLTVRKAIDRDAEAIYELICDLEKTRFPKNIFIELFNKNISEKTIGYFVAQIDDQVVGFGSLYINKLPHHCGKVGEIKELVVSREHRNKNIGKLLVRELIEWADKQGALQVEVTAILPELRRNGFIKQMVLFIHIKNLYLNMHKMLIEPPIRLHKKRRTSFSIVIDTI